MWRILIVGLPLALSTIPSIAVNPIHVGTPLRTMTIFMILLSSQVLLAEHGIMVSSVVLRLLWAIAALLLIYPVFRTLVHRTSTAVKGVALTGVLFIGSLLPWLEPLSRYPSIAFGAPFSNANNDLAIYIVSADNFLHSGFKEFGRVVGYQAGTLANFEVAGSSSLVSTLAKLTGAPVWRVTTLAMYLTLIVTAVAIFYLSRLLEVSALTSGFVAVLGVTAPWSAQVPHNFFLSQALARMALVIALLCIAHLVRCRTRQDVATCIIGIWSATWLSLVSYPSGTIVSALFAALMTPALLVDPWRKNRATTNREILKRLVIALVAVAAVLPIVWSRWSLIWNNVSLYSRANVTGWQASTDSFALLIGVPAHWGGGSIFILFAGMLVVSLGFAAHHWREQDSGFLAAFIGICGVLTVFIIVISRVGISAYQSWKTLATIQVIVPVVLGVVLEAIRNRRDSRLAGGLVLSVLVALTVWNVRAGGATYRFTTQLPTMELENAAKDSRLPRENLLIGLRPYLETMIAPVILDLKGGIYASDTYLGPGSVDPNRCALVRGRKQRDVIQLTPHLQLTPRALCQGP